MAYFKKQWGILDIMNLQDLPEHRMHPLRMVITLFLPIDDSVNSGQWAFSDLVWHIGGSWSTLQLVCSIAWLTIDTTQGLALILVAAFSAGASAAHLLGPVLAVDRCFMVAAFAGLAVVPGWFLTLALVTRKRCCLYSWASFCSIISAASIAFLFAPQELLVYLPFYGLFHIYFLAYSQQIIFEGQTGDYSGATLDFFTDVPAVYFQLVYFLSLTRGFYPLMILMGLMMGGTYLDLEWQIWATLTAIALIWGTVSASRHVAQCFGLLVLAAPSVAAADSPLAGGPTPPPEASPAVPSPMPITIAFIIGGTGAWIVTLICEYSWVGVISWLMKVFKNLLTPSPTKVSAVVNLIANYMVASICPQPTMTCTVVSLGASVANAFFCFYYMRDARKGPEPSLRSEVHALASILHLCSKTGEFLTGGGDVTQIRAFSDMFATLSAVMSVLEGFEGEADQQHRRLLG